MVLNSKSAMPSLYHRWNLVYKTESCLEMGLKWLAATAFIENLSKESAYVHLDSQWSQPARLGDLGRWPNEDLCAPFFSVLGEGVDHIFFKVEILSNEDREWHESFSLVLGPDDPVEAVLGDVTTATVTILDQEAAGSLILPAPPIVSCLTWRITAFMS